MIVLLGACTYVFNLGFESYKEYVNLNEKSRTEHFFLKGIQALNPREFNDKDYSFLKNGLKKFEDKKQKELFKQAVDSYAEKRPKVFASRLNNFFKLTLQLQEQRFTLKDHHESKIKYYGSIFLSLMFIGSLLIYFFILNSTFKPIKVLYRRMVEFLNNRYTYEFTVPKNNEVGNLHATFNSLAQRVLKNMDELKTLDKAKSEFLSIASHELRTPLTSIKGSLSLLRIGFKDTFDEKAKGLMNIAENETDRLIRLINDLLDLAKIEARKFPLKKEWFSLNELIEKTSRSMNGLSRTAEVPIQIGGLPDIEIFADADRIQQVLTNFLSNAIKYNPKEKSVSIDVEIDPQEKLYVLVSDQGIGITPEDQEIIFQKFRQSTGPNNPLVKGTGLGLAIAKALIDEHGGSINVKSKPNEGATFYFTLVDWRYKLEKEEDLRLVS